MKVILRQTTPKLGNAGEIKNVRDGYARNFLFPRGLAEPATAESVAALNHKIAATARQADEERARYQALAEKLAKTEIRFTLKVGERGRAFGSITAQDIAAKLGEKSIAVEKQWIELAQGIKTIGEQIVKIRLPHDIAAEVKIVTEAEQNHD